MTSTGAEAAKTLPTSDQLGAVEVAAEERFCALVTRAGFAGLRLGEAVALGDLDHLRRVLLMQRQVQRAPGGAVGVRPPGYGSSDTGAAGSAGGRGLSLGTARRSC